MRPTPAATARPGRDASRQPARRRCEDYDRIYGIDKADLDEGGPSVVSLNGVIASMAVMEFMVWVTGLRAPQPLLTYRAERGVVRQSIDPPFEDCPYCCESRRRRRAA